MSHVAQKMSHVVQKSEPCGIKKRAIWHLPFLYKRWYNFSQVKNAMEKFEMKKTFGVLIL